MSGRFYYYGGGGNSPYGWVAWVIGLAVFVGLGILLLPIVGAIVLILAAVAVAGFLFRVVADLLSPGNREGNDMPGDMPGERRASSVPSAESCGTRTDCLRSDSLGRLGWAVISKRLTGKIAAITTGKTPD